MFKVPEPARQTFGPLASTAEDGNNGAFYFVSCEPGWALIAIASDGIGWEHVSVRADNGRRSRVPTWGEMCLVKDLFWGAEDVVMQLHPRRSEYVNNHPHVLHLWRPTHSPIPTPPSIAVGIVGEGVSA